MSDALYNKVDDLQLNQLRVEWVPRNVVRPNAYNPNKMTPQDRALLRQSLLEDGWTQPVVTLLDGTIVDGEQRWTTSGLPLAVADIQEIIDKLEDRKRAGHPESQSIIDRLYTARDRLAAAIADGLPGCIAAITGGLVPITRVDFGDDAHKMISTIRHNRARGSHSIDRMAAISSDLLQLGLDLGDLETRLGMSEEEVGRLLESLPVPDQVLQDMGPTGFSTAWEPTHISGLSGDRLAETGYQQSVEANAAGRDYQRAKAARDAEVQALGDQAVAAAEHASGAPLTYVEKDKIRKAAAQQAPALPPPPAQPVLKKLVFFITDVQFALVTQVLGDVPVDAFLALVAAEAERRGITL